MSTQASSTPADEDRLGSTMALITGVLYAVLLLYLGGWWMGRWMGNFSLLLFLMSMATMVFWLAERWHFKPRRLAAAQRIEEQAVRRAEELRRMGIDKVDSHVDEARDRVLMQPWWLDWTAGLFPVILAVFLLRSFLFEPFKIPSGSMIPTLQIGDLILVNKFHYGVRLPVINRKVVDNNAVARGDVIVFRYPVDPRVDYIKRVVALPGDEVVYSNKRLTLNGQPVPMSQLPDYYDEDSLRYALQFSEKLGSMEHRILNDKASPPFVVGAMQHPHAEACSYNAEGLRCVVPAGHYFVMGDNRDNSQDSRYWGFVPDENIVGRAFFVWMNFGNPSRIGAFN